MVAALPKIDFKNRLLLTALWQRSTRSANINSYSTSFMRLFELWYYLTAVKSWNHGMAFEGVQVKASWCILFYFYFNDYLKRLQIDKRLPRTFGRRMYNTFIDGFFTFLLLSRYNSFISPIFLNYWDDSCFVVTKPVQILNNLRLWNTFQSVSFLDV